MDVGFLRVVRVMRLLRLVHLSGNEGHRPALASGLISTFTFDPKHKVNASKPSLLHPAQFQQEDLARGHTGAQTELSFAVLLQLSLMAVSRLLPARLRKLIRVSKLQEDTTAA